MGNIRGQLTYEPTHLWDVGGAPEVNPQSHGEHATSMSTAHNVRIEPGSGMPLMLQQTRFSIVPVHHRTCGYDS